MKRILAPILLLILLFPALALGDTVGDLVVRDGIHYKKFTDVPFTGKVTVRTQRYAKDTSNHREISGLHWYHRWTDNIWYLDEYCR
jgi:hypothetical protein